MPRLLVITSLAAALAALCLLVPHDGPGPPATSPSRRVHWTVRHVDLAALRAVRDQRADVLHDGRAIELTTEVEPTCEIIAQLPPGVSASDLVLSLAHANPLGSPMGAVMRAPLRDSGAACRRFRELVLDEHELRVDR